MRKFQIRFAALTAIALLHFTVPFFGKKDLPGYLHSSSLKDLGHFYIPALTDSISKVNAELVWYVGTAVYELIAISLLLSIVFFGKGMRLAITIFAVKFLHWGAWHFTVMPIPDDIVWEFPTWVISAAMPFTQDLWFSGHVATSCLLVFSAFRTQLNWLKVICIAFAVFEAWLVLACRTHYSIDILGGIAVAYCAHRISVDLEQWFLSMSKSKVTTDPQPV